MARALDGRMRMPLAVSSSSCDDSCHDNRAASSRMPCCWLVRVSDGRSESTAAPLPGPAGPVLRWSLPTPSGKLPRGVLQRRSQPWDKRARVGKDQTPEYTPNLTLPSLNQAGRGMLGQGQTRGKESCPIPLRGDQKTLPWGRQPHLSQPRAPHQPGVSMQIPLLKSQLQGLWLVSVSFQQICPQASVPAGQGFLPSPTHLFVQNVLF